MIDYLYAERDALSYPAAQRILSAFPKARTVVIGHYKEIFARPGQNFSVQKRHPALILAVNRGRFLYEGAGNCQNFGYEGFYYASCAKNCLYQCDYCYLQGMYRSANPVLFVNIEDCLRETERLIGARKENGGVYLCLSYDTDLLSMERLLGYGRIWNTFAARFPASAHFTAEIRTKSGSRFFFQENEPCANMIFAWSVAPELRIAAYEKRTAPLAERLRAAKYAMDRGFRVRLCLDPVIDEGGDPAAAYAPLSAAIRDAGLSGGLDSVSLGAFRIPADFLKIMRRNAPCSPLSWDAYEIENGTASYAPERLREMNRALVGLLAEAGIAENKIFGWETGRCGGAEKGEQHGHGT